MKLDARIPRKNQKPPRHQDYCRESQRDDYVVVYRFDGEKYILNKKTSIPQQ